MMTLDVTVRRRGGLVFGLVIALAGGAVHAQVTLRQGSNADLEFKEFASPVTAEIQLADLTKAPFGKAWDAPSFGKFYCDDVAITSMDITKVQELNRSAVKLTIWTHLRARMQEDDKSVALEFAIEEGDRHVFLGRIDDISVDAGDHTQTHESFEIPRAEYDELFADGKNPLLKVTMSVRTN